MKLFECSNIRTKERGTWCGGKSCRRNVSCQSRWEISDKKYFLTEKSEEEGSWHFVRVACVCSELTAVCILVQNEKGKLFVKKKKIYFGRR